MRSAIGALALAGLLLPAAASAQDALFPPANPGGAIAPPTVETIVPDVTSATGGVVRVLDKISGVVRDVELRTGERAEAGLLTVELGECRYPTQNPSGDAYAQLTILYRSQPEPAFWGWMIASAPALNAMDHPRYDVWVLRCITS